MTTVKQPSMRPTNKLMVAAAVGPAAAEVWGQVMPSLAPALAGASTTALVGTAAACFAGYWIKDRANVAIPADK